MHEFLVNPALKSPLPSANIKKSPLKSPQKSTKIDEIIENKNKFEPLNIKQPTVNQLKSINFNKTDTGFHPQKKGRFNKTAEAVQNFFVQPNSLGVNKRSGENSPKNGGKNEGQKVNVVNLRLPTLDNNIKGNYGNVTSPGNNNGSVQGILQFNYNGPNTSIKHKLMTEPENVDAYGKKINDSMQVIHLKQKDKTFGLDLDRSKLQKPLTGYIVTEKEEKDRRGLSGKYPNNNVKMKLNNINNSGSNNINSLNNNIAVGQYKTTKVSSKNKYSGNRKEEAKQIQKIFNNLKGYLDNI